MSSNFDFLFNYLEKERISFDKSEFLFQVQSHPNYPTLLSISDTLSFFNIENGLIRVLASDIELLPNSFIALLKHEKNDDVNKAKPSYIVEKGNQFYCLDSNSNKTKILERNELESLWSGIVFLVEKSEEEVESRTKKKMLWKITSIGYFGLFIIMLQYISPNWQSSLFVIFPILGLVCSLAAVKDLFGIKSKFINNFCNITDSSSCESVVDSKKWKIFKIISFSDLSIIFFSVQIFGLLIFFLRSEAESYFIIQKIMFLCAFPLILVSLYYQKFVEKKWCPICLLIIGVLTLEMVCVSALYTAFTDLQINSLIVFGFTFLTVIFFWYLLKKNFLEIKQLKEFQIEANRFLRDYEIFKNNLLVSNKVQQILIQSDDSIILGNPDARLKMIIITSPFCGFCANTHKIIEEILDKYSEKVCFNIYFNFSNLKNEKLKKIYHQLLSIYFNHGQKVFIKVLRDWFKNKDENELNIYVNSAAKELNFDFLLEKQFKWCKLNHINYTPEIIINGYFLPRKFDKNNLIYFINDLSEEETFMD